MFKQKSENSSIMLREESRSDTRVGNAVATQNKLSLKANPNERVTKIPFNGLISNRLLTGLPSEDFSAVLPRLEPVFLDANKCLYRPEDQMHFVYFPESAVLTHLHLLRDGSTTEGAMVGRDGMIGLSALLSSCIASHWVQVLLSGNALRIPTSVLKDEFDRRYAVQRMVLFYAGARLEQLSQRAVCAGRHRLQSRFCTWLLMLLDRIGENELALTQEEAARHLGVRRAGVTVVANALKNTGAIRYSRGVINVLNRATLLDSACECYQQLG